MACCLHAGALSNLDVFLTVCFFLVSWVEGKLASNKTEEWIIKEVDNICTIFPGFLGSEVRDGVFEHVKKAFFRAEVVTALPEGTCGWKEERKLWSSKVETVEL